MNTDKNLAELKEQLIAKTNEIMKIDGLDYETAPDHLTNYYTQRARYELLQKYLGENQILVANKNAEGEVTYDTVARDSLPADVVNDIENTTPYVTEYAADATDKAEVNLKTNVQNYWVFVDQKTGDELLRLFRDERNGKVDVMLNPTLTYTQAAQKFSQIVFEQNNQISQLNFAQALLYMKRGFNLKRANQHTTYKLVDGGFQFKYAGEPFSPMRNPLFVSDDLLAEDWQVAER